MRTEDEKEMIRQAWWLRNFPNGMLGLENDWAARLFLDNPGLHFRNNNCDSGVCELCGAFGNETFSVWRDFQRKFLM